jgi:uncharacterized protein (DUF2126 family)
MPVIIEGYAPPKDNRIEKLMVTPDPWVIEVNVHPAKTWKEVVTNYNILFEAALESRLGSEKFMLDGKHTGTGGGNHITLGGVSPADSPLLRRPDLLRSMLLSGSIIRVCRICSPPRLSGQPVRHHVLTKAAPKCFTNLKLLLTKFPIRAKAKCRFGWSIDLFRNLLIDLTGNTHRAEFCIDKLYSPDSSSGRLGILELRGFDMPPNKQMCLVQLLLIEHWFRGSGKNPTKENWCAGEPSCTINS